MRVIAGQFRSRVLTAPPGLSTRPTSDRLRETLFNVLAPRMEGAAFLDLYAGSGAVGIEAISRGAARVTFVEREDAALKVLRGNLERLGVTSKSRIHAGSVSVYLRRGTTARPTLFDIVFLDPPYDAEQEYAATLDLLGGSASIHLAPSAIVIAEHRRKQLLEAEYGNLRRTRLLQQGDAALSFYAFETHSSAT
jgi:16S rRNA (guanine966-N2)-methyltransferase